MPTRTHLSPHTATTSWLQIAAWAGLTLALMSVGVRVGTDLVVRSIDEQTEARWFAGLLPPSVPIDDPAWQRAQQVFQRLLTDAPLRPLPYRLFLLEDLDQPNAVAVPGGGVGVTPELLQEVESDIGLAMVLAHELGHHQYRHGLKRVGRILLWNVVLNLMFGRANSGGLNLALQLTEASYSREQEREADHFALRRVHAVYGDTEGALAFFELIQQRYDRGNASWLGFLSSHPPTAERLADLRQLQQQLRQGD